MKKLVILIVLAAAGTLALAHSGGTDRRGCHTDHRTGLWHCH